ncbi:MAG: outer membrane beta-barrel protein [Elusimicrobiota bacterium]
MLLLGTAAQAQVYGVPLFEAGEHGVALHLGVAAPAAKNGFNSYAKPGPAVDLQYLYYPSDWVALGAELGMFKFGKKSSSSSSGEASMTDLGVLMRVNLIRERTWTPYVLGGVGYHSSTFKAASARPGEQVCFGNTCAESLSDKAKGLSVTTGAGVEAFIMHGLSLIGEARFHEFRMSYGNRAQSMSYLVGARMWFRKKEEK